MNGNFFGNMFGKRGYDMGIRFIWFNNSKKKKKKYIFFNKKINKTFSVTFFHHILD